jgi:hypothetical protein
LWAEVVGGSLRIVFAFSKDLHVLDHIYVLSAVIDFERVFGTDIDAYLRDFELLLQLADFDIGTDCKYKEIF